MSYRVIIDMAKALPKLEKLNLDLGIFKEFSVLLDIDADNPDDACYLAYRIFCDKILEQNSKHEIKTMLKELKNDFKVVQLIES